jgi:thioredoxin-related protein
MGRKVKVKGIIFELIRFNNEIQTMKRSTFIIAAILLSITRLSAQTAEIKWLSITEAEKLMKKEPRKVVVDIYTDWCGWCKRLDATTYKDPSVVEYINKNYYPVKFNAESKESIAFQGSSYSYDPARRTNSLTGILMGNSTGYPTTTFLNEKMEVISVVPGYQQAPMMSNILRYFGENHYLNTDWNTYLSSVQK